MSRTCSADCRAIGKLCNPASGRCVTKTGAIGKVLMTRSAPVKLSIRVDDHVQQNMLLQERQERQELIAERERALRNATIARERADLLTAETSILHDQIESLEAKLRGCDATKTDLAAASREVEKLKREKGQVETKLDQTVAFYTALVNITTHPEKLRTFEDRDKVQAAVRAVDDAGKKRELKETYWLLHSEDRARGLGLPKAPIRTAQNIEKAFKNIAAEDARSALRYRCQEVDAKVERAERRLREAEAEMASVRARGRSTDADQSKIRSLEEIIKTQESSIRSLQQVAASCREMQQTIAQKNESHRREMLAKNEAHRRRIDELMANQTLSQRGELERVRRAHEADLLAKNEAHRRRIDELMANQTRSQRLRVEQLRGEHREEVQRLRVQAAAELNARLRLASSKRQRSSASGSRGPASKRVRLAPAEFTFPVEQSPRRNPTRAARPKRSMKN